MTKAPFRSNSNRRVSPLRVYTNTCPFELVATPTPSPMYTPGGIVRKFGTESNGISGVVALAIASGAGTGPCVNAGPPPSRRPPTTIALRRRIP
ncbi:MAG: hypothetical protein DMG02_24730 [Acidobacteria bacterium]|nr:MAG: hypothetical protein DMG02_24730 [Acidobacteriota bacterium]